MTDIAPISGTVTGDTTMSDRARQHLWMHFTRLGVYSHDHEVPVMVRGEGAYVWDQHGRRYLDGLAGLFTSQIGHGRTELAEAGAKQAGELAYFPLWTYAHPRAIELADRITALTPGDLNRVFFTSGGSEAVESAWKLARQYFRVIGSPPATRRSAATSPTTARRWERSPSRASPISRCRSSRSSPGHGRSPTPTSTGRPTSTTTSRPSGATRRTRSSGRS